MWVVELMARIDNNKGPSKNRSSLLIMLVLFISLAACAAAGYMFYEMKNLKSDLADNGEKIADTSASVAVEPVYISLDTFTATLLPGAQWQNPVVYIGLTLRLIDDNAQKLAQKFLPELRSRVFLLLASYSVDQLASPEGKKNLIDNIKQELSTPFSAGQKLPVEDVLINEFILR